MKTFEEGRYSSTLETSVRNQNIMHVVKRKKPKKQWFLKFITP
jgi:hypothetical protein